MYFRKFTTLLFVSMFSVLFTSASACADYQALIGLNFQRGTADRSFEDAKQEVDTRSKSFYLRSYFSPISIDQSAYPASIRYASFLERASGFSLSYRNLNRDNQVTFRDSDIGALKISDEEENRLTMGVFSSVSEKLFLSLELEQTEYDNSERESLRAARLDVGYYILDSARISAGFGHNRRQYKPYIFEDNNIYNDAIFLSYFHIFRPGSPRPISLELDFEEEKNWSSTLSLTAEYTLTPNIVVGFKLTQSDFEVNNSNYDGQFIRFNYYWSEMFALLSYIGKGTQDYSSGSEMDIQQAGLSLQHYF